jgi:esterase/lipase
MLFSFIQVHAFVSLFFLSSVGHSRTDIGVDTSTEFERAVGKIKLEILENEKVILFHSRNTRILHHNKPTSCVILNIHGLYQSPKDQISIAEYFFKKGCNVYSPLLRAHWMTDKLAFQKIRNEDWSKQIYESYLISRGLGHEVFVVGHSTGGTLAWELAVFLSTVPNEISKLKGILLLAPALKLNFGVKLLAKFASLFNLGRFNKNGFDVEYDAYYKDSFAGVLVNQLALRVSEMKPKNHIPQVLIYTTILDGTVMNSEVNRIKKECPSMIDWREYPETYGIFHDSIQRGILDIPDGAPQSWINQNLESVLDHFYFDLVYQAGSQVPGDCKVSENH